MNEDTAVAAPKPTLKLEPIKGLVGPNYLSTEYYREYDFVDVDGRSRTYRISDPVAVYYRLGGTTHRVIDEDGVVHCVPAPGQNGCVLRWKNRNVETGAAPVSF